MLLGGDKDFGGDCTLTVDGGDSASVSDAAGGVGILVDSTT